MVLGGEAIVSSSALYTSNMSVVSTSKYIKFHFYYVSAITFSSNCLIKLIRTPVRFRVNIVPGTVVH